MNEIWVLSVRTSLPNVCRSSDDLKVTFESFDTFEKARDAMRRKIKYFAFSKSEMFDGAGHMIHFQEYIDRFMIEDFDLDEDVLTVEVMRKIMDILTRAFSGKDVEPDLMEGEYTDCMLSAEIDNGTISVSGHEEGPSNGINPTLNTNILSMTEKKDYYLYIDDLLGQNYSAELYIDLKQTEIK